MGKLKLHQYLNLLIAITAILSLCIFSLNVTACGLLHKKQRATFDDIKHFFVAQRKEVITFIGYSGAEYEDKATMLEKASDILSKFDPSRTIVNIGATRDGIGAVYELAKHRGFITTGIVSTRTKQSNKISPCVDYVFFVEDQTWGGFIEGSDQLSPTSRAIVENSHILFGIGGGKVERDELIAAKRLRKNVHFFPADMNHKKARENALKKGLPVPKKFGGAAGEVF